MLETKHSTLVRFYLALLCPIAMDNVAFVACFVDAKVGGISSKPTILPTGAPPLQKEFPQPLTSPHSNITISIDHGIPECLSKYGANLNEASCIDALIHIPLDSTSKVFGKRSDVGVEVGLPFRFSGGKFNLHKVIKATHW